jgi:glycine/D-amino acid oxidase-like deaminating enzyme
MVVNMFANSRHVAVIGGGVFGCSVAVELANAGHQVTLFEQAPQLMRGASRNNHNRLHLGYHYPRSISTAEQCIVGYRQYRARFPESVYTDFEKVYCIAEQGSRTSSEQYLAFCDRLKLPYAVIDPKRRSAAISDCSLAIACREGVYDHGALASALASELCRKPLTQVHCETRVNAIVRDGQGFRLQCSSGLKSPKFDFVVNASYADINRLTAPLGHIVSDYQFSYTLIPVIALDIPPQGITVMDGPFMSLLPQGRSGNFLLYHVRHSVIDQKVGTTLDPAWLSVSHNPFARLDKTKHFARMIAECAAFVPALRGAKLVDFLHGPRAVLAHRNRDDARPSYLHDYADGYFTIFSGKVDHSLQIAEQLTAAVEARASASVGGQALLRVVG